MSDETIKLSEYFQNWLGTEATPEQVARAARILARAQAVMGDQESALNWLQAPKKRFEKRSPLQMLCTESGGRLVEQMLIQIDEGMFA
ncbi:MAG: MbcA/ParS/Xre antitoxin family protein [Thermomicrobiales bacterium]